MDDPIRRNRLFVLVAILVAVFIGARAGYQTDPDIRAAFDGFLGIAAQQTAKPALDAKDAPGGEAEQADAPAEPEPKQDVAGPIVPELDIVRVEPSGDAVFAGKVEPGWDVELRANGEAIGSAKAGGTGEWAIVIDKPLNAGASDITLHAISPDGAMTVNAPDRVAVDISETRKTQPLVVVTRPDAPSDIVQAPKTQVAESTGGTEDAPETQVTQGTGGTEDVSETQRAETADATEDVPDGAVALEVEEKPGRTDQEPQIAVVQPPDAETGPDAGAAGPEQVQGAQSAGQATTPDEDGEPETPVRQLAEETGAASGEGLISRDQPQTGQAQTAEAPATKDNSTDAVSEQTEIAIDVVEKTEKEQLFVSGRANPGAIVRAYSDNVAIGDAVADAAGKWRISGSGPVTSSNDTVTIRADGLDTRTGEPRARAEVRFDQIAPGETVIALMPVPEERASSPDPDYDRLIVQRGDNLWHIARKIYGEGVRFTTIYKANQGQIRDPDLIYPGQVFAVPKGVLRQGDTAG